MLPAAECGGLHPIAAGLHAAPSPPMVLGRVVKEKLAGGIRALSKARPIAITEQVAHRVRNRLEKLIRVLQATLESLYDCAAGPDQSRVGRLAAEHLVDRRDSLLRYLAVRENSLDHIAQAHPEDQRFGMKPPFRAVGPMSGRLSRRCGWNQPCPAERIENVVERFEFLRSVAVRGWRRIDEIETRESVDKSGGFGFSPPHGSGARKSGSTGIS